MSDARPPITVRQASAADLAPLCELVLLLFEHQHAGAPELFRAPARADRAEDARLADYLRGVLAAERDWVLVAVADAAVIGMIHLGLEEAPASPSVPFRRARREGWIEHIAVRPGQRRAGVGRALVEAGVAWLAARGAERVGLQVWSFNAGAAAFFEQLGFRERTRRFDRAV